MLWCFCHTCSQSCFKLYCFKYYYICLDTKWCGAGNNANGYNDLGSINLVDYCCRDHDNWAV